MDQGAKMTKLDAIPADAFQSWETSLQASIRTCGSLEEAAQKCVAMIYDQFRDSIVLARFYAVIPFGKLPQDAHRFATAFAAARNVNEALHDDTPVLSLLGTRGELSAWNERRSSRGHLAIPLVSPAFVEEIPMVSRMLKELGFPIEWVTGASKVVTTDLFGRLGGFFYVEDAATALDHQNRRIIPAQDFVSKHGVKTVFGTAGMYVRSRMLVTLIVFCRETLDRAALRHSFMPLGNVITNATSAIVHRGKLFAG